VQQTSDQPWDARLHEGIRAHSATRYRAIVVSNEEAAQVERLRYLLSPGVKENFETSGMQPRSSGATTARLLPIGCFPPVLPVVGG